MNDGLVPCWVGGLGARSQTVSRSRGKNRVASWVSCPRGTKSPGTVSGAPYTSSAEEHPRSCLGAMRMSNRTRGSSSSQLGPTRQAISADLRCQWNLSTSPFDCGWYAEVRCNRVPCSCDRTDHNSDVNCNPLSDVMTDGTPKRATQ